MRNLKMMAKEYEEYVDYLNSLSDKEILDLPEATKMEKEDIINHPKHYKAANGIETIDVIEGFTGDPISWSMGNVIKYVCRWREKNGVEDLRKAQFYLNRLIEIAEREEANENEG